MKTFLTSFVVIIAMAGGTAFGQSNDELAEIRAQLQTLMQRVDKLERENAALKQENARVAQAAQPAPDAPAQKESDWTDSVMIKGDVRYRHEQTNDDMQTDERVRHLLRARVSMEAQANESIAVGVGITTTENGNPRGGNVALDGAFSRKSLDLDLAYIDWTIAEGIHAIGGKMRMPFFRPGQSLFYDSDINPEGIAFTYARGPLFGSAYGYWIDENVPVTGTTSTAADTMMYGAQLGTRLPIGTSSLVLAGMYYDLSAAQGRRPFYNGSANGNSLRGSGTSAVLRYDFQVVELAAEFNTRLAGLPLQVFGDYAQNLDAELDTALTLGATFGKASNPGTWEAGFAWQSLDKDAVFAQFIDSDFGMGMTDSDGWILRAGYAPMKNWALNATYFLNERNKDVGMPTDFERLLVDFNVKF